MTVLRDHEDMWKGLAVMLAGAVAGSAAAYAPARFSLEDTAGHRHTPEEWAASRAVVLFFVTTDCPVANSYVPEMNRLHQHYAALGVLFFAVQTDADAGEGATRQYAADYAYSYPMLIDPQQSLASSAGATLTPQVAVYSPAGKLLYLGRIDNRVEDFGKQRLKATVFDLKDALDAVLADKPVAQPRTRSVGCAIVYKHPATR